MPVRPLSKDLQQKAEEELHEVPDRIQEDLKYIRDWLSTQPHLQARTGIFVVSMPHFPYNPFLNDQWLLSFLRSCKFNYERTKEKLELFSTQQRKVPEFFGNRDPFCDEVQEVLKRGIFMVLPQTADPAGPKILFYRAKSCDPSNINVRSLMKVVLMIMEILYLEDDNCAVAGISPVLDIEGFSYKYLIQVTPNFIKKIYVCFLYAYPTRLKRVGFVNCPSFFQIIYRLLKIFAPEKIKSRLQLYNNFDDVYKDIPRSIFPNDYGGDEKSSDELGEEWKLKIENYRKWFLKNSQSCTNEVNQVPY